MKPHKEKFKHIKEGLIAEKKIKKTDSIKSVSKKLKKIIKNKKLEKAASITHDSNGLHIEFKDGLLFQPGSAAIKLVNQKTIQQVLKAIAKINSDYQIHVEGHTDDSVMQGSIKYPSNWELSASRGFSIMRELVSIGIKENRVSVTAFAHTRPKVPYKGLKGKKLKLARSANRRVVVWLE